MYKAIIWDLDGTLLDTTSGVTYAVKYTINQLGLNMPSDDVIKSFVGPPMQLSFKNLYGMNEEEALKAANLFRSNYKEKSLFMAELYQNVLNVLETLKQKGYVMAVATNKSHENAMQILTYFGIDKYCDFMMGSDFGGVLKKADIIKKCLEELNVLPEESVYIGDSIFDLKGAEEIGMEFIGVTYGFDFKKGDVTTHRMVDSLKELDDIL